MLDIKIGEDLDLDVTENGDIRLVDDIPQNIKTRLLWIEREWRLGPEIGFPWFTEVFVKKPDAEAIRSYIIDTVMEVEGVEDCDATLLSFDLAKRYIVFEFRASTADGVYSEEVELNG